MDAHIATAKNIVLTVDLPAVGTIDISDFLRCFTTAVSSYYRKTVCVPLFLCLLFKQFKEKL